MPIVVAVAVVLSLVAAGAAWAVTRPGTSTVDELADGGERMIIPMMQLGSGELPGGATWVLEARRDGGVCTTLRLSSGPPARERCLRMRGYRPIGNSMTRILRGPNGTTYVTLGQVTDRAERVRVAPEGAEPWEVPALGGGTGLDVRFFVMHMSENVAVSLTALAADGAVVASISRPKLPTS